MNLRNLIGVSNMAFDMGTANISVFVEGIGRIQLRKDVDPDTKPHYQEDTLYMERSVTITNEKGTMEASGDDAFKCVGRISENYVKRPVRIGRIYDKTAYEHIVHQLVCKINPNYDFRVRSGFLRPTMVVGVPCNDTHVERRAVREIFETKLRAKPVLVLEPVAAAIGAGLEFNERKACAIIDIGGGTTDFTVLCAGAVLDKYTESFEYGGDLMDMAIIEGIKKELGILIGSSSAEWIKKKIGSALPFPHRSLKANVQGRPLDPKSDRRAEVTDEQVRNWLLPEIKKIADKLQFHVHHIAEGQIHSDLLDNGIWLTGGTSLLEGLDKYLTTTLKMPVRLVPHPLLSVIDGAALILTDSELQKRYKLVS